MKTLMVLLGICLICTFARGEGEPPAPAVEAVTPAPVPTPAVEATVPAAVAVPAAPAAPVTPKPVVKIVVILPEQVDTEMFWYYYSDVAQHIVQSKIEQSLINAGFDVVDLATVKQLQAAGSLDAITSSDGARALATSAGATYVIVGKATAVKASEGAAYGVTVVRSSAEVTARIIRASDGKVVESADASAQKGGQSSRAAGQDALKTAGEQVARKLASALKRITEPAPGT